ncbi:MAG: MerR family regulatory protein, partial [Alphaproteobacteria bacterium]|nr:MerR family regulatory protein [Alphaproteobacteria bacterium]
IRAWERRKLISPPRRTATGTRLYTDADVETMRRAQQARGSGPESPPAS